MAPTEMPEWRLRVQKGPCIFLYRKRAGKVATSHMLSRMRHWYSRLRPNLRILRTPKLRLLEFTDASDKMWRHCASDDRPRSCRSFVELNLRSGCASLSKQEKVDTQRMLDAAEYTKRKLLDRRTWNLRHSISLEDVLELHARITGTKAGGGGDQLLPLVDMLSQAKHNFSLAGRVLAWFHKHKPFADGNSRLAELLVSIIAAQAMPRLGFPTHVRALAAAKAGRIRPTGAKDFAAYVIEQAWLACPCPKAKRELNELA